MKTNEKNEPGSTLLWLAKCRSLIAACAVTGLVCQTLRGQDLPFDSSSTGADGAFHVNVPFTPGRYAMGVAFDAARSQMVLFGGSSGSNDTWIWQGTDWIKLNPSNSPPAMSDHTMTYDSDRQQVVLFGGFTSSGYTNATWVWNGTNWAKKTPANSPPSRTLAAMAYDKGRREVVLFGGSTAGGVIGDTWIWNGTNWSERTLLVTHPSPRTAVLAYDEARQQVVLFGGHLGAGDASAETWIWDGTNWNQRFPPTAPPGLFQHVMAYDEVRQQTVVFGGHTGGNSGVYIYVNDTWVWDGSNWQQQNPWHAPSARGYCGAAYDSVRGLFIVAGGYSGFSDTWAWDGKDWLAVSGGGYQTFNLSSNAGGVWNFTTISVPSGLTILFKNSQGNTPTRWLATGNVNIAGTLDLSGRPGAPSGLNVPPREGGPGGFAGGLGGAPSFQGSSPAGSPGQGPGGGLPGLSSGLLGQSGTYASSYGNPFIQPLIGGSGGGGSPANGANFGNHGGGGGGAILIASSRDITVSGTIRANGGSGSNLSPGSSQSGDGSGGAIRLRADRITIGTSGRLEATSDGRIRLESYERAIQGTIAPANPTNTVVSAPVPDVPGAQGTLLITSVAGQNVVQPPSGSLQNPDVVFTAAGPVTVTVTSTNVPDATPVQLRITTTGQVISATNTLSGGTTTFTVTVPKGIGTLQAFADIALTSP